MTKRCIALLTASLLALPLPRGATPGFDCDISCNISPQQFEDLLLPPLIETMRTVDRRIYHLDGSVAFAASDIAAGIQPNQNVTNEADPDHANINI